MEVFNPGETMSTSKEAHESSDPEVENSTQGADTVYASIFADNQLPKDMGFLSVICLGWNICNSWLAVAVTMAIGLPQGGCAILYGVLVVFVAYTCCVGTLAELASVYPTSGGQYHYTSILAPKSVSRALVKPPAPAWPDWKADSNRHIELYLRYGECLCLGFYLGGSLDPLPGIHPGGGNPIQSRLHTKRLALLLDLPDQQYSVCAIQHIRDPYNIRNVQHRM